MGRMRGRHFVVLTFLVAELLGGCESTQPGSLELVFHWPEGAPDLEDPALTEEERYTLWGNLEEWPNWNDQGDQLNMGARLVSAGPRSSLR